MTEYNKLLKQLATLDRRHSKSCHHYNVSRAALIDRIRAVAPPPPPPPPASDPQLEAARTSWRRWLERYRAAWARMFDNRAPHQLDNLEENLNAIYGWGTDERLEQKDEAAENAVIEAQEKEVEEVAQLAAKVLGDR